MYKRFDHLSISEISLSLLIKFHTKFQQGGNDTENCRTRDGLNNFKSRFFLPF